MFTMPELGIQEIDLLTARFPFAHGDQWEYHNNSWVIVKPCGKKIVTRAPKTS